LPDLEAQVAAGALPPDAAAEAALAGFLAARAVTPRPDGSS